MAQHGKQIQFCVGNHCMGSGTLLKSIVCEHRSSLHDLQVNIYHAKKCKKHEYISRNAATFPGHDQVCYQSTVQMSANVRCIIVYGMGSLHIWEDTVNVNNRIVLFLNRFLSNMSPRPVTYLSLSKLQKPAIGFCSFYKYLQICLKKRCCNTVVNIHLSQLKGAAG